uniref:Sororin C-terminal region domain-containing protein n=1 Tax=Chelonoidis abingdonii TaxID=106734 RepID=A0A8C0J680_CHEAB
LSGRRPRSAGAASAGSKVRGDAVSPPPRRRYKRTAGSPTRRDFHRKPLVEKEMVGSPLPAPVVKQSIMVKKIMPRKQQPAVALTEAEQIPCVTGTAWTPRRSPRISQKAGKENFPVESSEAKDCGSTDANPILASSLPANASGLDERDVLMSKKMHLSYSLLDAHPKKCSLFGFEKLQVPDALADVSPVGKVSPAQETPVKPDALGSTKEWDTNIPGISFPKEKRKKRRIPQIDKSELDEWAAQMNAQFEEAEQFDLVVERRLSPIICIILLYIELMCCFFSLKINKIVLSVKKKKKKKRKTPGKGVCL